LERGDAIFVAGGGGFEAAAIARRLRALGFENLVGGDGADPDLRDPARVDAFFAAVRPRYVFLTGGRSGGIACNQRRPADLMLDNLRVETAVIGAAHRYGVERLLYLGSSCMYPRECDQPMRPDSLLTGPLEPTSRSYALAKLAGLELCRAFASQHRAAFFTVIPANVFGPGDDASSESAHVIGALLGRMHEAKCRGAAEVAVWGSGRARRDFLFVEDLANACVYAMQRYPGVEPLNVSGGLDLSIRELAERIQKVVGFPGRLVFDADRPDGAPTKLLDGEPLRQLGWNATTPLEEALAVTYRALVAREGSGAGSHA
jgi:GDP-L-fucose synthase